jgi:short-subunit dehydrogenase
MIVEANLLGVISGSRAAVEAMRPHGGHLINLGSMSAFGPVPGLAVYGATKHAVVAFGESLQGDLDEAGIPIRVHAVCPDGVDTGMVSERVNDNDAAIIFSSGKKLLDPGEVADRVVELLDSKKLLLTIPRARVPLLRLTGWFPRFGLKAAAFFKKVGERNRRKVRAT